MVAPPVLVMGVSGSGKSSVGESLARALRDRDEPADFVDADDLHPAANKEKMRRGVPLTDEDRWPWLDRCAQRIAEVQASGKRCVMANSALRRVYRDRLRAVDPSLEIAYLDGSAAVIADRQRHRHHEYMPDSLLASQFATLEPLQDDERGGRVPIDGSIDDTVAAVLALLDAEGALTSG